MTNLRPGEVSVITEIISRDPTPKFTDASREFRDRTGKSISLSSWKRRRASLGISLPDAPKSMTPATRAEIEARIIEARAGKEEDAKSKLNVKPMFVDPIACVRRKGFGVSSY